MVGFVDVPQQVPRADIDAGYPRDVTLAPSVAPPVVIEDTVGDMTVGTTLTRTTTLPDPESALIMLIPEINRVKTKRSILIVFIIS